MFCAILSLIRAIKYQYQSIQNFVRFSPCWSQDSGFGGGGETPFIYCCFISIWIQRLALHPAKKFWHTKLGLLAQELVMKFHQHKNLCCLHTLPPQTPPTPTPASDKRENLFVSFAFPSQLKDILHMNKIVPKLMPCHYIGNDLLGVVWSVATPLWKQFQYFSVYWKW